VQRDILRSYRGNVH